MNPLTAPIDLAHEALGHSPHPAVVLLPAGSWICSNLCDLMAMATGDPRYDDAARISMGVGLAGAPVAAATGLRDYSRMEDDPRHVATATTHAVGNAIVGTLFGASYLLRHRDEAAGRRPGVAARLLGLAGGALGLYTMWLGGVLVENHGVGVEPHPWGHDHARGRARLDPDAPLGTHEPAAMG